MDIDIDVSTSTTHSDSTSRDYSRSILLATAIAIFLWIAREYPAWKAEKTAATTKKTHEEQPNNSNTQQPTTTTTSTPPANDSLWPKTFSLRWIPYLPFAVIYLLAKALWNTLRFLVFHSIFTAERMALHLQAGFEVSVDWTVNHGPEFVQRKVIAPIYSLTQHVYQSSALATARILLEQKVFPAVLVAALKCQALATSVISQLVFFVGQMAEPAMKALEWFAVACIYNPSLAIYVRLRVIGLTFIQTAKIYLNELAKDAADLGWVLVKAAQWIWAWTLQPLGRRLYTLGEVIYARLLVFVPWLASKLYSAVIQPVGTSVLEGFKILRSHPTLLGGLQALSAKVQEKGALALDKLESVNWLVLLETVLTKAVTFTYEYTVLILTLVGEGLRTFAVDIVPNAYNDLMMALQVARPVVEWLIAKFLAIVHPLWQVVSVVSWTVFTNIGPIVTMLHQRVIVPSIEFWESKIVPVLGMVANAVVSQARVLSSLLVQTAPAVAAALGPVWNGLVRVVEFLQQVMEHLLARVGILSAGLGVELQKQMEWLRPQFEAWKTQTGLLVDELVVSTNNFMVDWVKKEKRD